MTADESLRRFGLVPRDEALPEIREILAQEAAAERRGERTEDDLALLCCVQLFSRGLLEDVLRIWDAKRAGMDLGCVIDVQLLCGAGLEETKHYLAAEDTDSSREALKYIADCERSGDFRKFSPDEQLRTYRRYFA